MKMLSLETELKENAYPGRGIVIENTKNVKKELQDYLKMEKIKKTKD